MVLQRTWDPRPLGSQVRFLAGAFYSFRQESFDFRESFKSFNKRIYEFKKAFKSLSQQWAFQSSNLLRWLDFFRNLRSDQRLYNILFEDAKIAKTKGKRIEAIIRGHEQLEADEQSRQSKREHDSWQSGVNQTEEGIYGTFGRRPSI